MNFKKKLAQIETSKIVTIVGICLMSCIILYTGITSALFYDGNELADHTEYNETSNICSASNLNMNISIYPCSVQDIDGKDITQYVDFKWEGINSRGISWVFVYDGNLSKGQIAVQTNQSYNTTIQTEQWVTDFPINNVANITNITETEYPCELGTATNTQKFNVTYTDSTYKIICFETYTGIKPSFLASGWAMLPENVTKYRNVWVDHTSDINYLGYDLLDQNLSYYKVQNIEFQPNQELKTRWVYTAKDGKKSGKWSIFGYSSESSIQDAIASGAYIFVDPWFNSSWTYKKNITIDYTKVNGSQTNFPVLINLTDTDLRDDAQADGDDIVFTDSDNSQLDHEIEFFNGTTGFLVAWVRIPTLSNTTNTTIQMYYGNAGASNQENVSGVWDDNFVMVQHLSETPTAYMNDSTSNDNDGTTSGMDSADQVAGQIDGSLDFDGGDDYVSLGSANNIMEGWDEVTFSMWINPDALDTHLFHKYYVVEFQHTAGHFRFDIYGKTYANFLYSATGVPLHLVGKYDGSNIYLYLNGIQTGTARSTSGAIPSSAYDLAIGSQSFSHADNFNGIIDEVRISNTARSAGWIATEYNNQFSPDSFYSVGGEETGDDTYPQFSNYQDNNNTLTDSGTGLFNVTVENTNGTVILEINGENITADNVSNLFNVSYVFSSAGTYPYKWHSWGNGTNENYNVSVERDYVVNATPHILLDVITPPNFDDINVTQNEFFNVTVNVTCLNANCGEINVSLDPWDGSSWTYKKNITINHSKVNGSQTNFPVLINLTDTDLRDDAQADGDDIVFTDSSDTQLDHEIEYFNGTDGRLVAWVRIPTLSNTTDTVIQMYYGNAGASNQENATGVWDDNFVLVQHLSETPTAYMNDSTSNDNDGTTSGMDSADQVAGQIDGSLDFDGDNDYVSSAHSSSLNISEAITISAFVYMHSSGSYPAVVSKAEGVQDWGFNLQFAVATRKINLYLEPANEAWDKISNTAVPLNTQTHIVAIYDGIDNIQYYYNGNPDGSFTVTGGGIRPNIGALLIGKRVDGFSYDGLIDEVHISNVVRSAGWIATEYNSQHSPDSFYSVGGEETVEEAKSGLVDDTIGATPFYTNESNPRNITLSEGESQLVTFWVNATGEPATHLFYAYANMTSNMSVSNITDEWNVTIITEEAEDTCTYTSNNWEVDCSDNCIITENIDIGGNNISITGTGTFKINGGNVSNYEELYIKGTDESNICEVYCYGGCFG